MAGMISRKEFSEQVERLLAKSKGNPDIMSAIIKICEVNKVEPESAKRLISAPLKEKLQAEAEQLNMINRHTRSQSTLAGFFTEKK